MFCLYLSHYNIKILEKTILNRKINIKILALILLPLLMFAQSNIHDKYLVKNWTTENGLPSNAINAIAQMDYLWIGTDAGLARFDGIKFKVFTKMNTPAITNNHITALHFDNQNQLWIGTDGGGLLSYKSGKWNNYRLSNNHIKSITGDWNRNIWIGTGYGLYKFKDGVIEKFSVDDGLAGNIITSLEFDSWGNLWTGSLQRGVTKYFDHSFVVFDAGNGLENLLITSLFSDKMGNLFIGTIDGIFKMNYSNHLITKIKGTDYLPVTCFLRKDKELWFGTMNDGLKILSPGGIIKYNISHDEHINCMLEDIDGNFWIGTESGGITQIQMKRSNIENIEVPIQQFYRKPWFYTFCLIIIVLSILVFIFLHQKPKNITQINQKKKDDTEIDFEIVSNLEKIMEKDNLFLDPDLTMKSLAQKLRIHNNSLSKIINDHYKINYNDFINQYRIEEAKTLLLKEKKKTISDIMYRCGFYSKSTFNTAFKKFTDKTPSQFRKDNS